MTLTEMTLDQRRHLIDTEQVWQAWDGARRRVSGHNGTLGWKSVSGREYLVRVDGPAARRKARSLGPRSPDTERILHDFTMGKQRAREAFAGTSVRLREMARMSRALRLARVPLPAAKIVRVLHRRGALGRNVTVAGTNAIYAYEAAAGVFVGTDMLATGDLDILLDSRRKLGLRGDEDSPVLMDMLRDADRSFSKVGAQGFRAVNADGYQVDLIKPTPHDVVFSKEADTLGPGDDLRAAHIPNMRWVANAPKFEAMAIGADGLPVPLVCPDPRAFALYKLWMGSMDATRDPVKRVRDVQQAHAVAAIINEHYPLLPFRPEHLACFPRRAADLGADADFFRLS